MASDHVLRAVTEDGAFRVIAALTTETARGVLGAQKVRGPFARRLADLVTATVLVRETMAPDLRVQAILSDGKRNRFSADAMPEGITRGLSQLVAGATAGILETMNHLTVMRSLHNGALQQGQVMLDAARPVADALMEYFRVSEQVASFVAIGSRFAGDELGAAAGYVVQLLPEVTEAPLQMMTERLASFPPVEALLADTAATAADPQRVLGRLLDGVPHKQTARNDVRFGCNCSAERVLASLATLPPHDLAELIAADEVLEIGCDYCGKQYKIAPEHLRGLLSNN
ncbi:MAG: Hsp33 family molecular chaperone HslO [Deltaproteobacteria bacterium]|nr:Hsp33 family molecular chaperone HslO [Deltaproteobacteria bacterium]